MPIYTQAGNPIEFQENPDNHPPLYKLHQPISTNTINLQEILEKIKPNWNTYEIQHLITNINQHLTENKIRHHPIITNQEQQDYINQTENESDQRQNETTIKELEEQNYQLENEINTLNKEITNLTKENYEQKQTNTHNRQLLTQIENKQKITLQQKINEQEQTIHEQTKNLESLRTYKIEQTKEINTLKDKNKKLYDQITIQTQTIKTLNQEIQTLQAQPYIEENDQLTQKLNDIIQLATTTKRNIKTKKRKIIIDSTDTDKNDWSNDPDINTDLIPF